MKRVDRAGCGPRLPGVEIPAGSALANEHLVPVLWPHPHIRKYWESGKHFTEGATQPWVQALLYQLCRALDVRRAVELGCYLGATSAWLAAAIESNGGGSLTVVDVGDEYISRTKERISAMALSGVETAYVKRPSLEYLPEIPPNTQFVFLDDDKDKVPAKLDLIRARCPGAVVAIHDMETLTQGIEGILRLDTPILHGTGYLGLLRV